MALHNLNIHFNLMLFTDDTSVSISEPSNKTHCKSLNLVILKYMNASLIID